MLNLSITQKTIALKKMKHIFSVLVAGLFLFQTSLKAQNSNYTVKHDTCLNKKFSIVFYVIQDSLNSLPNNPLGNPQNYINTYSLSAVINVLNTAFARICVSFENCKTVIIPNSEYNNWKVGITDSVVMSNWYYPNTINFYIPNTIDNPLDDGSTTTYGSFIPATGTVMPKDAIVMDKTLQNLLFGPGMGVDLLHTFGHYFGLSHTYAELSSGNENYDMVLAPSQEAANGSNSATHGDKISDTYADSYPNGYYDTSACNYIYRYDLGLKDGAGNYYTPPIDNIMSAYKYCRCRFTQEQYNRMAYFILTRRMYLH